MSCVALKKTRVSGCSLIPRSMLFRFSRKLIPAKAETKGPGKTAEKWPVSKPCLRLGFSPASLFQRKTIRILHTRNYENECLYRYAHLRFSTVLVRGSVSKGAIRLKNHFHWLQQRLGGQWKSSVGFKTEIPANNKKEVEDGSSLHFAAGGRIGSARPLSSLRYRSSVMCLSLLRRSTTVRATDFLPSANTIRCA